MGLCRMTVPALPATQSAGVATSAYANNIRSLQQWHRDTAPVFKGLAWDGTSGLQAGVSGEFATATNTTVGFGSAGSFENTPVINVGGWTVNAADADPESLVVPESGIYHIDISISYAANNTGYRRCALLLNGSTVAGVYAQIQSAPTNLTYMGISGIVDLTAGNQLDIQALQNSGSTLAATVFLSAHWIRST